MWWGGGLNPLLVDSEEVLQAAILQRFMEERMLAGSYVLRHNELDSDDDMLALEDDEIRELQAARRERKTGTIIFRASRHFGRFFNSRKYSDIDLAVGSRTFHAHRIVLCSWSDVFKSSLASPSGTSSDNGTWVDGNTTSYRDATIHTLQEDPECCEIFDQFLRFMYEGTISVSGNNVFPLLRLSNKYEVQELRALCDSYLMNLHSDVSSATTVLRQAVENKMQQTVESCLSVIRTNFELVTAEQLRNLDGELVVALLDSPQNLAVSEEFAVFEKLTPWLTECTGEMFMKVMNCIRFVYMTAKQLNEVVSSDVMRRAQKSDPGFAVDVFAQHALYRESDYTEFTRPIPRPRLYLKEPPFIFDVISEDGFNAVSSDRTTTITNVLKEFEYKDKDGQKRRFYKRDDLEKWQIRLTTVSRPSEDDVTTWGVKINLSHTLYRRGSCTCKAEAAVQIKFGDHGSLQFFAAENASHTEEAVFVFETSPVLPSRPEVIIYRASVLVHLGNSPAEGPSHNSSTDDIDLLREMMGIGHWPRMQMLF